MRAPKVKTELRNALLAYKKLFLFVALFSFVINVLMLAPSLYMLQVYDRVLTSRNPDTLLLLTLIVILLFAIIGALEFTRSRILVRMGAALEKRINKRIFSAMFESALSRAVSSPSQALADLMTVRQFVTGSGIFAFVDSPWTPIYLLVIFMLHPLLGVIAVVGALVLFCLAIATERLTNPLLAQASKEANANSAYVSTNLQNAEVIESMGMFGHLHKRWEGRQEHMLALQAAASDRAGAVSSVTKFFRISIQSLVLGVGAWLAIKGEATPGVMIAASILMGRALAPVEQSIATWKNMINARGAYSRLELLLHAFPMRKKGMSLPAPTGRVSVGGLVAVPPGSQRRVLLGVSFEVQPGEIVGIIGPSASGKSTLARSLVGVWPAAGGTVRLDGADISQWNKDQLGPHIGYLPQDVELFDGTVAENIARFGEVESEQVIDAATRAGVHEMILQLTEGYDTRIGAGGSALSGGQRQRVGLARALYGGPALIVLDEPNSNLDDSGESALVQAIQQLKSEGKTVFLITHRRPVLAVVDKLMVLKEGQIAMFGPRDKVIAGLSQVAQVAQRAPQLPQAVGEKRAAEPGPPSARKSA